MQDTRGIKGKSKDLQNVVNICPTWEVSEMSHSHNREVLLP